MGLARQLTQPAAGERSRTAFNQQCARVRLSGVVVQNAGLDWSCPSNVYWQHKARFPANVAPKQCQTCRHDW